ncbi:MAG TPA: formylmethanofuran dehydrogenase subunit C [Candidatus Altiarchaeales archaeon]|nr:formylmethanofuran dehydrogenase subunit C [Candidatus Altiarchaeales archaeon]
MKTILLKPKGELPTGLECESIKPENFIGKNLEKISSIGVFLKGKKMPLHKFFTVKGKVAEKREEQRIVIKGDLSRVKRIGELMLGGTIIVKGDVGHHLGEFMKGGMIVVEGSAKSRIGTAMEGGTIDIMGNARNYVGCAALGETVGMVGGNILIHGNANFDIGRCIRGGEITILGNVYSFVGSYADGGTITIGSITQSRVGYKMKSGRLSVLDSNFKVPFYFRYLKDKSNFLVYRGDLSCEGRGLIYIKKSGF